MTEKNKFTAIRMPEGLHHRAKMAAVQSNKTLKDWLIEAIQDKLLKDNDKK